MTVLQNTMVQYIRYITIKNLFHSYSVPPAYITGSLEPILKNNTAGRANTPKSLAICLSSILTKSIPAPSASSSMCSISANTRPHCLQSSLSGDKLHVNKHVHGKEKLYIPHYRYYMYREKHGYTWQLECSWAHIFWSGPYCEKLFAFLAVTRFNINIS